MSLTRFAISRPVIVALATIGLMVFGIYSYFSLGRNLFPSVDFPAVAISADYPGASPSEMEKLVIKPIEDQLDGMQNLKQINATSQEGTASIYAQFNLGTNLDTAASDVQQRVETARAFMPTDLDPPYIERQNNSAEPIVIEALRSDQMRGPQLGDLVKDRLVPEIKAIEGVQNVVVNGQPRREFHVFPQQQRILAAGYTLDDLFNTLARNNSNLPGGRIDSPVSETSVSVHADVNSASDIAAIPLFNTALPALPTKVSPLHIGDLATVEDGHSEQRQVSHFDGSQAVYLDIQRQTTSDTVKTTQNIRAGLKQIAAEYPQIHFQEIEASADYTETSINGVLQSLVEGIFLTALVMLLFLHAWRNAVVVMVAIPTSLLATFIAMRAFGFTVDIISMMGLGLTIGILVDDSIVVLENITRHRDLGQNPIDAAINGRTEIGSAAIAITLVDVIVFTPIAFMSGIVGEFMREFGIVIVVATLFSLLVSFTLTPLLAAKWSMRQRSAAPPHWLGWFQRGFEAVQRWYSTRALPAGLRHGTFVGFTCVLLIVSALTLPADPKAAAFLNLFIAAVILAVSLLALAFSPLMRRYRDVAMPACAAHRSAARTVLGDFALWIRTRPLAVARWIALAPKRIPSTVVALALPLGLAFIFGVLPKVGSEFIPSAPTGVVNISLQFPQGQPLARTQTVVNALEDRMMKLQDVQSVLSTSGEIDSGYGSLLGGNYAKFTVITYRNKRNSQDRIASQIRQLAPPLAPGAKVTVAGESGSSGAASPIYYNVAGPDSVIDGAANKLAAFIRGIPGTLDVQTGLQSAAPRLNIHVNPQHAALMGVAPGDAATAARIALGGAVATKVRTDTGLVDVRLQLPYDERNNLDYVRQIKVRSTTGAMVDLGSVADFSWTKAPTQIDRQDRHRIVSVTGQLDPTSHVSIGDVNAKVQQALKAGLLPAGASLKTEGDTQLQQETASGMAFAMLTSGVLIYMLMVVLYGSFLEPFIIMFSIPVAIVGALVGLSIHHQTLNLFSLIGIVMLFGLVAKNGILLVDYTNTLHYKRAMPVTEALLTAAKTRFRPIVMTTCAMIFGMLPLSLGLTEGAESRASMGTVLIGGLTSSLLLTLFLVPMVYNTWIGYLARVRDRVDNQRAVSAEMEPALV